jgi:SH3 domain-containing protein
MHSSSGMSLERRGRSLPPAVILLVLLSAAAVLLSGCGSISDKPEYAYVAAPEAALRDRVAAVYTKTGVIHNGERVAVLEHMQNKRFVRVRSPRGEEGWVQERYLTDQETYDQLQQLAEKFKNMPGQAVAVTRAQVNLHAIPGRKTDHLYQLAENQKVDLLQRQTVDRNAPAPAPQPDKDKKDEKDQKDSGKDQKDKDRETDKDDDQPDKPDQPPMPEDWWLIRDPQKHVGWVLGRMLYVDVPMDIAQYAEGQRIIAFFILDEVQEDEQKFPEYLVLLSENKDGLPYDYDQVRVFTRNKNRHRYETAYRERNLSGFLPVKVGKENFEREGDLRTFTLQLKDDAGNLREQKYKFNPPIVRRVLAPGEEPPKVHHKPLKTRRSR